MPTTIAQPRLRVGGRRLPPNNPGDFQGEDGHLYSSYYFASGSLTLKSYDLFVTPVGTTGQGFANAMTYTETNMENAQRIPDQLAYKIVDLGVGWNLDIALADIQALLKNGYLVFKRPKFETVIAPLFMLPGGWGIAGATTKTSAEVWASGLQTPAVRRKLKRPIYYSPGATFKWQLAFANATGTAVSLVGNCISTVDLYGDLVAEKPE